MRYTCTLVTLDETLALEIPKEHRRLPQPTAIEQKRLFADAEALGKFPCWAGRRILSRFGEDVQHDLLGVSFV